VPILAWCTSSGLILIPRHLAFAKVALESGHDVTIAFDHVLNGLLDTYQLPCITDVDWPEAIEGVLVATNIAVEVTGT